MSDAEIYRRIRGQGFDAARYADRDMLYRDARWAADRVERLLTALRSYGCHRMTCAVDTQQLRVAWRDGDEVECNCGLAHALMLETPMPTSDQPTPLATLLAELDAHWNAVGPLHLEATDDGVDIADTGLRCLAEVPDRLGVTSQERDGIVRLVNAYPALREGIAQLQREKATDAWHTGWQQAVKERDEARRECDQWREKWNATLDREARRNAEILQLKAANNEMREVLLTLSTADPKLLAEQPEMTAGIARMALQLANHWAAKGSVDAA